MTLRYARSALFTCYVCVFPATKINKDLDGLGIDERI